MPLPAVHAPEFLILLAAAVVSVTLLRVLRLSPVLGYLIAGTLIGPNGLGLISDMAGTEAIAEMGVVFLLFMIGLDLSWDRLKTMRMQVLGIGGAQLFVTAALGVVVARLLGHPFTSALLVGSGLALSSTALVLQVLESRKELASQTGRLSLAILLMQDLAVLPLLVLVPMLVHHEGSLLEALLAATTRAALALAVIIIAGRILLRPLFRLIARLDSGELFVATTLLVVFFISWVTESAGLSMALGAFIAGMLVAETEFQHQVEVDVKPYKSLLMGLFFMTVGMKIDVAFIASHWHAVLLGTLGLMALKSASLLGVLRAFGYPHRTSIHTALLMAQGGEFAFILFGLADYGGVIPHTLAQELLLMIALSMAATPLLDTLGARLERRGWMRLRTTPELLAQESSDLEGHVVLVGYGRMGQIIGRALTSEKVPYIALDTNPREVSLARKRMEPVYFGDGARPEILSSLGIARARALVITLHESNQATALVTILRQSYPAPPMFVRGRDGDHCAQLTALGATLAVPELQVSSMRLVAGLLANLGHPEEAIQRLMHQLRSA